MLIYQKLVFFKAICLTTLNSNNDLMEIINKYDSLIENIELNNEEKIEVFNIFKDIINSVQQNYVYRSCELIDLLINKFPEWEKDLLIIKIKILISLHDIKEAFTNANKYILSIGIDKEIAILKLEILMSMDYEKVVLEVEELLKYLKDNIE